MCLHCEIRLDRDGDNIILNINYKSYYILNTRNRFQYIQCNSETDPKNRLKPETIIFHKTLDRPETDPTREHS